MQVKTNALKLKIKQMKRWATWYANHDGRRLRLLKAEVKKSLKLGYMTDKLQQFKQDIDACNAFWKQEQYSASNVDSEFLATMRAINRIIRPARRRGLFQKITKHLGMRDLAKRTGIKERVLAGWASHNLLSKSSYKGYFSAKAVAEAQKVQQCLKRGYKVAEIKAQGLDQCYSKLATVKVAVHNWWAYNAGRGSGMNSPKKIVYFLILPILVIGTFAGVFALLSLFSNDDEPATTEPVNQMATVAAEAQTLLNQQRALTDTLSAESKKQLQAGLLSFKLNSPESRTIRTAIAYSDNASALINRGDASSEDVAILRQIMLEKAVRQRLVAAVIDEAPIAVIEGATVEAETGPTATTSDATEEVSTDSEAMVAETSASNDDLDLSTALNSLDNSDTITHTVINDIITKQGNLMQKLSASGEVTFLANLSDVVDGNLAAGVLQNDLLEKLANESTAATMTVQEKAQVAAIFIAAADLSLQRGGFAATDKSILQQISATQNES